MSKYNTDSLFTKSEPVFSLRGVYLDLTRGRIPRLAELKRRMDIFAALRINHVQLYVEHVFPFSLGNGRFDTENMIHPHELRELDAYCRERGIDFVPSLSLFGHMYEILELDEYRHLQENKNPDAQEWLNPTARRWRHRMNHHTINSTMEESRQLLSRLMDEYLPHFSSPLVNVCCDETFDLGKSSGPDTAGLFLDHVLWLYERVVKKEGKTMMMWGDMLVHYPEVVKKLPEDIIILNWDYDPYCGDDTSRFFAGRPNSFVNCPGVHGWNRFTSCAPAALANMSRMIGFAQAHGAAGILNTDWGDWGHPNPWEPSLLFLAMGALWSWNGLDASLDPPRDADGKISRLEHGRPLPRLAELTRAAEQMAQALAQVFPDLPADMFRILNLIPEELNHWTRFNYTLDRLAFGEDDYYGPFPSDPEKIAAQIALLEQLEQEAGAGFDPADGSASDSAPADGSPFNPADDSDTAAPDPAANARLALLLSLTGVRMNGLRHLAVLQLKHGGSIEPGLKERFFPVLERYRSLTDLLWKRQNKASELSRIHQALDEAAEEMRGR